MFSKLENKLRFSVGCGKILNAKLRCDDNNILIFLNDDDVRYLKRDDFKKILMCEFDISGCFKKVIAISQKKDNINLYVHVKLYRHDDQMKSL